MKVKATHYICIKEMIKVPGEGDRPATTKPGKDLLVIRSGETRPVTKQEMELLKKEAVGKFQIVKEEEK